MMRIGSKQLIALQCDALRVAELEADTRALRAEAAQAAAALRARNLLDELDPSFDLDRRLMLADLPLSSAGGALHESAFVALVDRERQWADRTRFVHQWARQETEEK